MLKKLALMLVTIVAIMAIACGGDPTPTPAPTTSPVLPTATRVAPTPRPPAPTPTALPAAPAAETFSSSMGLFSLAHPSGWISRESGDGTGVVVASSLGALARYDDGSAAKADDMVVNVTLTPVELYQAAFLPVESGVGAAGIAEGLLQVYQSINETELGEIETRQVSGVELAIVPASNSQSEGALLMFEPIPGVVAFATLTASPDASTAGIEQVLLIMASVVVDGSVQDFLEAIDAPPPSPLV